MKKVVLLAVAPVSLSLPEGACCPPDPGGVAETVLACARAGASMVHLHVRDAHGEQTESLHCYGLTLQAIRAGSDIVLQGSTGGLTALTLDQRCVALNHPLTQAASLNLGSTNFADDVYVNRWPDIRHWAERMREAGVVPELEAFDLSMVETARRLYEESLIPPAPLNAALGFPGALPATGRALAAMAAEISRLPHTFWGLIHHGMRDLSLLAAAIGLGAGMIRVGYEDSAYISPGRVAADNAGLVRQAAALIRAMGHEVATPGQARALLGIQKQ